MKILMITSYYLPYLAGAELYVKEISERLVRDNNQVYVLTKRLKNLKKREEINGVKVHRVRSLNVQQLRSLFSMPGLFFQALKISKHVDYIHAHITYPNGIIAYLVSKIRKKPYIITLQGDELMDYPEKKLLKFLKWPIGSALRNAGSVHCISKALADKATSYFGVKKEKIKIIANGVDLAGFESAKKIEIRNGKKNVISVSRLSDKNNIEMLIKAIRHVKNARLIVIGDGPERKKLEALKSRINADVEFIGNIDHDKIASYMKAGDVFARVPKTEGLGIVFLEAMAAGIPIVASNVGGIPDIIKDNENGLIASNDNEYEIANRINLLINDSKLRKNVIANGKKFVMDYDWEKVYNETLKLYR